MSESLSVGETQDHRSGEAGQPPLDAVQPADRVRALSDALRACRRGGSIRVAVPGAPGAQFYGTSITISPLPADRIDARTVSTWSYPGDVAPTLEATGWKVASSARLRTGTTRITATRGFELDPDDPVGVASVVDAMRTVIALSVGGSDDRTWSIEPQPKGVVEWVDAGRAADLEDAIRRMARRRGGWLEVRRTRGPSPTIRLNVRDHRGTIEVWPAGRDWASSIPRRRLGPAGIEVDSLLAELQASLGDPSPGGNGGSPETSLSLRENLDAIQAWPSALSEDLGYTSLVASVLVGAGIGLVVAPGGFPGRDVSQIVNWVVNWFVDACVIGWVAMGGGWAISVAALRLGDRLGWQIPTVRAIVAAVAIAVPVAIGLVPITMRGEWRGLFVTLLAIAVVVAALAQLGRRVLRGRGGT